MHLLLKKNQNSPSVDSCATVAEDEKSNVEDLSQTSEDFEKPEEVAVTLVSSVIVGAKPKAVKRQEALRLESELNEVTDKQETIISEAKLQIRQLEEYIDSIKNKPITTSSVQTNSFNSISVGTQVSIVTSRLTVCTQTVVEMTSRSSHTMKNPESAVKKTQRTASQNKETFTLIEKLPKIVLVAGSHGRNLSEVKIKESNIPKPVIKLKNLIVGKQYKIHTAELVQTKFGEAVLLELKKHVVFLPQRVTDEYKPQIANFSPEKYAVIFRGTEDVGKPYPAASFEIVESK
ncbi:hypothetical protein JTB14_006727 [Gonioctena quinquepunctata]|nr:hypothetical protein JTB14_006727 [Gonioctena quinquepunctata]